MDDTLGLVELSLSLSFFSAFSLSHSSEETLQTIDNQDNFIFFFNNFIFGRRVIGSTSLNLNENQVSLYLNFHVKNSSHFLFLFLPISHSPFISSHLTFHIHNFQTKVERERERKFVVALKPSDVTQSGRIRKS